MVKLVDITQKIEKEKINIKKFKEFYQKIDALVFSCDFWNSGVDSLKMSEIENDKFYIQAKYREYKLVVGKPQVFLNIIDIKRKGKIRVADPKFLDLAKKIAQEYENIFKKETVIEYSKTNIFQENLDYIDKILQK